MPHSVGEIQSRRTHRSRTINAGADIAAVQIDMAVVATATHGEQSGGRTGGAEPEAQRQGVLRNINVRISVRTGTGIEDGVGTAGRMNRRGRQHAVHRADPRIVGVSTARGDRKTQVCSAAGRVGLECSRTIVNLQHVREAAAGGLFQLQRHQAVVGQSAELEEVAGSIVVADIAQHRGLLGAAVEREVETVRTANAVVVLGFQLQRRAAQGNPEPILVVVLIVWLHANPVSAGGRKCQVDLAASIVVRVEVSPILIAVGSVAGTIDQIEQAGSAGIAGVLACHGKDIAGLPGEGPIVSV